MSIVSIAGVMKSQSGYEFPDYQEKIEQLVLNVTKPARYTGGEFGSVIKDKSKVDVRFAFCFPDVYDVGMSHLGMKILSKSATFRFLTKFLLLMFEASRLHPQSLPHGFQSLNECYFPLIAVQCL